MPESRKKFKCGRTPSFLLILKKEVAKLSELNLKSSKLKKDQQKLPPINTRPKLSWISHNTRTMKKFVNNENSIKRIEVLQKQSSLNKGKQARKKAKKKLGKQGKRGKKPLRKSLFGGFGKTSLSDSVSEVSEEEKENNSMRKSKSGLRKS